MTESLLEPRQFGKHRARITKPQSVGESGGREVIHTRTTQVDEGYKGKHAKVNWTPMAERGKK
jgi:hypothetical protein